MADLATLKHYVSITFALTRREIEARYKATMFGLVWYLLSNTFMIALYSVVFSAIFRGRWGHPELAGINFTALIFVGLLFFNCLNEVLSRAPGAYISQASIVKRMVFPVFLLPIVPITVALFNLAVAAVILFAYCVYAGVLMSPAALQILVVMIPFVLTMTAISFFLAASAVYVRDIVHITNLLGAALMFMSSLFYPVELLPSPVNWIAFFNPVNYPIDEARRLLFLGGTMDVGRFMNALGLSSALLLVSIWWYRLLRPGFIDVL